MQSFYLTIFVFLLSLNILFSQNNWKNGYIIQLSKDTVHGQIKLREYDKMSVLCMFRNDENSPTMEYTPKEIISYVIPNIGYYVSRTIDNTKLVFLEFLVEGKLDLYYIRDDDGDRFFIQTDSLPLKEVVYLEKFVGDDRGNTYMYQSKSHIGLLHYYTKDAPKLWNRIDNRKPDFKNLRNIVVDYHNAVCPNENCITYRNTDTYVNILLGFHFGNVNFRTIYGEDNFDDHLLTFGIQLRVGSPRISKRLYLRTGAMLFEIINHNPSLSNHQWVIKFPMHLEYKIPMKYGITPKLSLGTNAYSIGAFNVGGSLGMDVNFTSKASLSLMYERDFLNFDGFIDSSENPISSLLLGVDYIFN